MIDNAGCRTTNGPAEGACILIAKATIRVREEDITAIANLDEASQAPSLGNLRLWGRRWEHCPRRIRNGTGKDRLPIEHRIITRLTRPRDDASRSGGI